MKTIKDHKPYLNRQPAQELESDINQKTFYRTLLIAILVIFSLNFLSSHLLNLFSTNSGYRLVRTKWDMLKNLEEPVDILIIGDSSGNQGIDTDFIKNKTGKSALNLATIGNMLALNDYWLLSEYIKKFGPPSCVINIHVYDIWYRHANSAAIAQIPLSPIQMIPKLSDVGLGIKFQTKYLLAKYIPSWSENTSLKTIFMRPWRIHKQDIPVSNSGFVSVSNANPENVLKDTETHKEFVRQNIFKPSKENIYALKRMGELSDSKGFSLAIVNSPMFEGLYKEASLKHYLSDVNQFIREITDSYDNMHTLFSTPETFSSLMMQNADHLTSESAQFYTLRLLENLKCEI